VLALIKHVGHAIARIVSFAVHNTKIVDMRWEGL
jgi:hypothetical protein